MNWESDPAVMADLAQGRLRGKIDQLTESLTGRFSDHHRFMVAFRLQRIDNDTRRSPERTMRRKIKELEAAGYAVTMTA